MRERTPRIVWVDTEHLHFWRPNIRALTDRGVNVEEVAYPGSDLIALCEGADLLIFHSGTMVPVANASEILTLLRMSHPEMTIALQTEVPPPLLAGMYDFIVPALIGLESFLNLIDTSLSKRA